MFNEAYWINPILEERKIEILIGNTITNEDILKYGYDLAYIANKLELKDFTVEINCKRIKSMSDALIKYLEEVILYYKELGFKYITHIFNSKQKYSENLVLICSKAGLKNCRFITD